jgi:monoamine oxidase
MDGGRSTQARIAGGYGTLIDFLVAECRGAGAAILLGSAVTAIEAIDGERVLVCCATGNKIVGDTAILTMPPPLLQQIALPDDVRERAPDAEHIGFGNVIKILLRFETRWWADQRPDLRDLTFLLSDERIPVWWTQFPDERPVLTGWFGGPKTEALAHLQEDQLSKRASLRSPRSSGFRLSNLSKVLWRRGLSTGETIRSLAAPIPTLLRVLDRRRPRWHVRTEARFSFRAKRSIAGRTWAPSRRHWQVVWRLHGLSSADKVIPRRGQGSSRTSAMAYSGDGKILV